MKSTIGFALLLTIAVALPAHAASDYYIKIDGVDGEAKPTRATTAVEPVRVEIAPMPLPPEPVTGTTVAPPSEGEGLTPVFLEIDGVKGESGKGKAMEDGGDGVTPDFSILLGGGLDQDDDADSVPSKDESVGLARALAVLEENAKASDQAIESVSLNYEKITTRVREPLKLFGFIPITATAVVEVDKLANAEVRYPWWTFLASGKNADVLGARVVSNLSSVLKAKHDAIKNAISTSK